MFFSVNAHHQVDSARYLASCSFQVYGDRGPRNISHNGIFNFAVLFFYGNGFHLHHGVSWQVGCATAQRQAARRLLVVGCPSRLVSGREVALVTARLRAVWRPECTRHMLGSEVTDRYLEVCFMPKVPANASMVNASLRMDVTTIDSM